MRIPGAKTLRTFSRWVRARIWHGALILGYHRITSTPGAFPEVCVSPEHFAEHLHVLGKHTRPIHLSTLVQHLKNGSLPEKAIAITFDDGYADNLYSAKPLLEKYEIPATVFVCTGYIGKEFWWDELERLITGSQTDPYALDLEVGTKKFRWDQTNISPEPEKPTFRDEFRRRLYHFLLTVDPDDQIRAMEVIRRWSEVSSPAISTLRAMSMEELLRLVDGGLIELGAHTRHHPMLPQLSFERQKEEIESSKRDLEALMGNHIDGFAYPNGRAVEQTKRIVRESGFTYACTSLHDVVRPGSDVYELTRFWQQDVDGNRFMTGINRWMRMRVH